MNLLKLYVEHEPNPANPPITLNDAKGLMTNIINVQLLVEDKSYHIPTHQPLMSLRKFMRTHEVDCAGESFKQGLLLSEEELDYIQLMHHLWFVKILGVTQAQVQMCLEMNREKMRDFRRKCRSRSTQDTRYSQDEPIPRPAPTPHNTQPWPINTPTQANNPSSTARICAFGSLVIPENNQPMEVDYPTGNMNESRPSQDARESTPYHRIAHRPQPAQQAS